MKVKVQKVDEKEVPTGRGSTGSYKYEFPEESFSGDWYKIEASELMRNNEILSLVASFRTQAINHHDAKTVSYRRNFQEKELYLKAIR